MWSVSASLCTYMLYVYVLEVRGPYCVVSICILVYVHVVCVRTGSEGAILCSQYLHPCVRTCCVLIGILTQAMARVWRDGQKKKVYIYRLLTTVSSDNCRVLCTGVHSQIYRNP